MSAGREPAAPSGVRPHEPAARRVSPRAPATRRVSRPTLGPLAALLAALACGQPAATDRPPATAGQPAPNDLSPTPGSERQAPEAMPEPTCAGVQDPLGDLAWIPVDVPLAAAIDLSAPDLATAAQRLARAATETEGLPIVAALGLGQLDVQLDILRGQLRAAELAPRELLLLHEPGGAVAWVFRVRCDLGALQKVMERAWGLRSRTTATGPVAEPGARPFPYDAVFLADDRVLLAPAGRGGALRRWIEAPPPALAPDRRRGKSPGELLAGLPPAPIRVVLAGRGLLAGGATASPRTLQAWPDRVELAP